MTRPRASIVVPSYGGANKLPVLLAALGAQRFEGDWEVIVVLDGVIDDSVAAIEAHRGELPLQVVRFEENRGRSAALNAGFAEAKGEVLIRCDDDLEPGPTYLADHVAAHGGPTPVGVVGLYRNVFGDTPYAKAYGQRYDRSVRAGAYSGELSDPRSFWAGNCSVTRATYGLVGGYDENFRGYGWEDIDWGYRLADAGVEIVLEPRLECVHHAANVDTLTRVRRAFESGEAVVIFDAKHGTCHLSEDGTSTGMPLRARLWEALVRRGADGADLDSLAVWSRRIDSILGRIPPAVGFRLISFAVDVAARAGYRTGLAKQGGSGLVGAAA